MNGITSLHSVSVLLAPLDAVGRTTDPADEFLLSPSEYTSIKVPHVVSGIQCNGRP